MAGSRLEKIGTIFSRINGLLRSGVTSAVDKPIWYDIYALHPPKDVPRFDRPAPKSKVRDLFYEEDLIRAKYHKNVKHIGQYNLLERTRPTQSRRFIEIYQNLKSNESLNDEEVFNKALENLHEKSDIDTSSWRDQTKSDEKEKRTSGLVDSFRNAQTIKPLNFKEMFDK